MSLSRSVLLAFLVLWAAIPAGAQAPTLDSTAVAARVERLAVYDDDGKLISEREILATMRPPRWGVWRPAVGALTGLLIFVLATNPGSDCTIYDPCTPRERFRRDLGPFIGLAVGAMLGFTIPDQSVDRWQAVEIIRAQRRAEKQRSAP